MFSAAPSAPCSLTVHQWLEVFQKAKLGDAHWKAVLERYSRLVVVRREKNHFTAILLKELVRLNRLVASLPNSLIYRRPNARSWTTVLS